jgi:hypothetical protein
VAKFANIFMSQKWGQKTHVYNTSTYVKKKELIKEFIYLFIYLPIFDKLKEDKILRCRDSLPGNSLPFEGTTLGIVISNSPTGNPSRGFA